MIVYKHYVIRFEVIQDLELKQLNFIFVLCICIYNVKIYYTDYTNKLEDKILLLSFITNIQNFIILLICNAILHNNYFILYILYVILLIVLNIILFNYICTKNENIKYDFSK